MNTYEVVSLYQSGLTTREVAERLGCGKTTVASLVKRAGVSRSKQIRYEVLQRRINRCPPISVDLLNYFDGLMISDGCMRPASPNCATSCYDQHSVCKEWLESIRCVLLSNGIEGSVRKERRTKKKTRGYVLKTRRYDQLDIIRKRWYPEWGKLVPRDIDLTNIALLKNWVYGDGTLCQKTLRLCTDSFLESDIDFLVGKLNEAGFRFGKMFFGMSKTGAKKFRIKLSQRDGLKDFYKFLGEPDKYFAYKWI